MEILGLLDTLESMICDSFKIPVIQKTLINEAEVLSVIDKIRLVLNSGEGFVKQSLSDSRKDIQPQKLQEMQKPSEKIISGDDADSKAQEIIQKAYQVAEEIRGGADKYADEVLLNLESTSERILRTVKNGRQRLKGVKGGSI